MIDFNLPAIGRGISGVYRMEVTGGWFYIGSSSDLLRRFWRWRYNFRNGNPKNKNILNLIGSIKSVSFEVIRVCDDYRGAEAALLQEEFDDAMCLNRCPMPDTQKGIRMPYGAVRKRDTRASGERHAPMPVSVFKKTGEFVGDFASKSRAATHLNISSSKINKYLRGEVGSVNGFVFKLKDQFGEYIPVPKFKSKTREGKTRLFYQVSKTGEVVGSYTNINEAARVTGADPKNINRVLVKHHKYKSCKGFSFVFADEFGDSLFANHELENKRK